MQFISDLFMCVSLYILIEIKSKLVSIMAQDPIEQTK